MTKEEAHELVSKFGGNITKAAESVGMPRTTFRQKLAGKRRTNSAAQPRKVGKTLSEFKERYDKDTIVPKRVTAALRELGSNWEYESVFVKTTGVSLADLGNYRDMFSEFYLTLKDGRRVWSGSKTMIQELKEMI